VPSGFVALPPEGPSAPAAADDAVPFDGWYPAASLARLRADMRIATDVPDTRLRDAAMAAMLAVADDLADWQAVQIAAGLMTLADVSDREVGGEKRLVVLWRRAVSSLVKADLDESQRGYDTKNGSVVGTELLDTTIGDHRRNARFAVRDILGRSRLTVGLI